MHHQMSSLYCNVSPEVKERFMGLCKELDLGPGTILAMLAEEWIPQQRADMALDHEALNRQADDQ